LDVVVPPNTTATVHLPSNDASRIQENGGGIPGNKQVRFVRVENGTAVFELESGNYHFSSPM
jgi:alpha-L-rhamnosidase